MADQTTPPTSPPPPAGHQETAAAPLDAAVAPAGLPKRQVFTRSRPMAADTPEEKAKRLAEMYDTGDDGKFDGELDLAPPPKPKAETPSPDGKPPAKPPAAPPASPPPPPAKPQHSKRVLRMATDLGIPQAEIDAASPEDLDDRVYVENREAIARIQTARGQDQVAAGGAGRQTPAEGGGQQQPPPPAESKFELELEGKDTYDPDLIAAVEKMAGGFMKEIADLKAQLGGVVQRDVAKERETAFETVDRVFAARPAVFGAGKRSEIGKDSAELARRMAVLQMVDGMKGSEPLEQKLALAADRLFGPAAPASPPPAPRRPAPSKEKWKEGGLAAPTQRDHADEPKGETRATKAVAAKLSELGLTDADFDDDPEMPG